MSISALLEKWHQDAEIGPNISGWKTVPAVSGSQHPLPDDLPIFLRNKLESQGINQLYSHQFEAWKLARMGGNVALSTGTASGKSLAFNLPVLTALSEDPLARALYLFPTKALAQDQYSSLKNLTSSDLSLKPAIYDGDTPQKDRPGIRANARIVLSNPDMLHTGILPHHTNWNDFFSHLKFIVIDEMHTYRGVFGSHVANVLRRLKRICTSYGIKPQFILASATIGNPRQLAEQLIEDSVSLIDKDGSARGDRHFLIFNPPVTDHALGLRKSTILETVRFAQDLYAWKLQTVVFARTRRTVEILLTYLQANAINQNAHPRKHIKAIDDHSSNAMMHERPAETIRGYRSGYLPSQRREIELGLRTGKVRIVVATNALELGIDIGGLGAAILTGYPGTIASARQQAGRAGRGEEPALALMVTSPNPLDQYLAHHPEYFFESSPEQALINPDHLLILLEHLRCALFELPFRKGEGFGRLPGNAIEEYLDFLISNREAHLSDGQYFWMADQYPAANISLRSASARSITLQAIDTDGKPSVVGTVDGESATWMVHPGAVYIHEGQQYYVQELDLEKQLAQLVPVGMDHYTEARRRTEITVLTKLAEAEVRGGIKANGEIQVTSQVIGYKKLRWMTNENLGDELLDMPATNLQTTGYWIGLSEATLARLRQTGAWTNDPNEYGPDWPALRDRVRARDRYSCQVCGTPETKRQHDVHHKIPFRQVARNASTPTIAIVEANRLENLITLCPTCHQNAEQNVRMRSGLAGLGFLLGNLAPLFLMCDPRDLGIHTEPTPAVFGHPVVVLYDEIPAGIGFSQKLFEMHQDLVSRALEVINLCACQDGCPACVGPGGENGLGGKAETRAILVECIETK